MGRRGHCHDNAVMEAFFSTVKKEVGERFESHADAMAELLDSLSLSMDSASLAYCCVARCAATPLGVTDERYDAKIPIWEDNRLARAAVTDLLLARIDGQGDDTSSAW